MARRRRTEFLGLMGALLALAVVACASDGSGSVTGGEATADTWSLGGGDSGPPTPGTAPGITPGMAPGTNSSEKWRFAGVYEPVSYATQTAALETYALPLREDDIFNWDAVSGRLGLAGMTPALLANGFAIRPSGTEEDVSEVYRELNEAEIPLFVTTDTWLHLYHVQFDEILRELEERQFYGDILAITERLIESAETLYGSSDGLLREAARLSLAYLWVARSLLTVADDPATAASSDVPALVAEDVDAELALIEAHFGFAASPLFTYDEDYSQYVPRGHYTRSERLKSYFKTLMWYGRMTMLLKGAPAACEVNSCEALVTAAQADVQTVAGLLLAHDLKTLEADGTPAAERWARVYLVTTFFVGLADDLTPLEYQDVMADVLGEVYELTSLVDAETLFAIRAALAQKRSPQIYGGTGGQVIVIGPGEELTPVMLDEILAKTKGFRFMGQRFIPDSFVMGRLVAPSVGRTAASGAFTTVRTDAGVIRGFPRGLDVMALLGSVRARTLLTELGDDDYADYDDAFAAMAAFFDGLDPGQWHLNLYWGWLYALRTLLDPPPEGTGQGFLNTEAWRDHSLTTALASWTELRHDTILYAKQSYTPVSTTTSDPGPPLPAPPGFVEPNPEFFARLLALNSMTIRGLDQMGVLEDEARGRLEALGELLRRMLDIVVRELAGEALTPGDEALLRDLGDELDSVLGGVEPAGVKTTMVADVHTDQNSRQVLEEAVGYTELLVAAVHLADGRTMLAAGPALSYYEFKHPMSDRLTDEKWRELLASDAAPAAPSWTAGFRVE